MALHGGGSGEFRATGLSFTVRGINAACAAVVRGGGTVRSDPEDRGDEGIYLADLTDPEGNAFMMSQDKQRLVGSAPAAIRRPLAGSGVTVPYPCGQWNKLVKLFGSLVVRASRRHWASTGMPSRMTSSGTCPKASRK